jgi:Uma2 family endonuclease
MQLALKSLAELEATRTDQSLDVMLTIPPGKSLVLENISWAGFEQLLDQLGNSRAARVAYDHGTLEIMAPLPRHAFFKESVSILVQEFADILNIDYEIFGSTTWKRQDLLSGLEPDNCFYIQNEPLIRGKIDLDLAQDPPPDLALEIDITSKSVNRMAIYARLGVPEVWRYENSQLSIFLLQGQQYIAAETSLTLPTFPVQDIIAFIDTHHADGKLAMRRAFRGWIKSNPVNEL